MKRPELITLISVLLFTGVSRGIGAETHTEVQPRPVNPSSPKILPDRCNAHDVSSLSGLATKWIGPRAFTGTNPPFPLYEHKADITQVTKWVSGGVGGVGSYQVAEQTGYHMGLSSKVFENFNILLSHGLSCKTKGKGAFLKELKNDLETRRKTNADFFTSRYSSQSGTFLSDRSEQNNPDISRDKKVLELFSAQISFLEEINKLSPAFYEGIEEQLKKNNTDSRLSDKLSTFIIALRQRLKLSSIDPIDTKLKELLINNPTFASLLPTSQTSYYRQLLLLGPQLSFTSSNPTKDESYSEHENRLKETLNKTLIGQEGTLNFLKTNKEGMSPVDRSLHWDRFEEAFQKDLEKISPEKRDTLRDSINEGLSELETKTNWTHSPPITEAREALLRAGRLMEKGTEDPLKSSRSDQENNEKYNLIDHTENLKSMFQRPNTKNSNSINDIITKAENKFKILIPLEIRNRIHEQDPFLLHLLGDDIYKIPSLKNYFLTGHSTALFNLKDSKIAASLWSGLQKKNPLIPNFSAIQNQEDYSKAREKLSKAIQPVLAKLKVRPDQTQSLTDGEKALLYALEMLDSRGNNNVLPYAYWPLGQADFYELQNIATRLTEEEKLLKEFKLSSTQVESRLASTIPIDNRVTGFHGLPTHARIAALTRMGNPADTEQATLQLLRDLKKDGTPLTTDYLKALAYKNHTPEELTTGLVSEIPQIVSLLAVLDKNNPINPNPKPLERTAFAKLIEGKNKIFSDGIRQAQTDFVQRLHNSQNPEEKQGLSEAWNTLNFFSDSPPGSFEEWVNNDDPNKNPPPADLTNLRIQWNEKALEKMLALNEAKEQEKRSIIDRLLSQKNRGNAAEDREAMEQELLLGLKEDEAFTALAKIKNSLGDRDPRYLNYRKALTQKIPYAFEGNLRAATSKLIEDEAKKQVAQTELLKSYSDLSWDPHHNAFIIDKDKIRITQKMIDDLSTKYPDFKVVFRDPNTGIDTPHLNGKNALQNWIHDRSVSFLNQGLYVGPDQWLPLNETTAVKFVTKGDEVTYELADLKTKEKELETQIESVKVDKEKYDNAKAVYGNFWHGAEGFGRGLGNTYTLGLIAGPENSAKTKALESTYNDLQKSAGQIDQFGNISNNGKTARTYKADHNQYLRSALNDEKNQIQKYVDNAQLTHDATLFLLTLPVGGIGGKIGTTVLSKAEVLMLQKSGLFVGKEIVTIAEVTALKKSLGFIGTGLGKATQMRMGLNSFGNLVSTSTKTAGLFSAPTAILYGNEWRVGLDTQNKIEKDYKEGKEWRKHPSEPTRKEGRSESDFEKEWREWYAEKVYDRNSNGIPDWLEPNLTGATTPGPDSANYLRQILATQKSFFLMNGVGGALPSSGMLTHIFGASLIEQSEQIARGGTPGDFTKNKTLLEGAKDAVIGTAHMIPGIVTQRLAMNAVPSGLQRFFTIKNFKTNTAELAGTAGFVVGQQGANSVRDGKLPSFTGDGALETLTSIGMDLYIGRSMARHSQYKDAEAALKKISPPPESNGQPRIAQSGQPPSTESPIRDLVKRYGQETIDQVVMSLPGRNQDIATSKSPQILKQALEYIKTRIPEVQSKLNNSTYKDTPIDQLRAEITNLQKATGGFNRLKATKNDLKNNELLLKEKTEALGLKEQQAAFSQWTQYYKGMEGQIEIDANLNYVDSPVVQQKLRDILPKDTAAAIIAAKKEIPLLTRVGQNLSRVAETLNNVTGLSSAIYDHTGHNPSAELQHQRANQVLIRAYTDAHGKPVQENLGSLILLNRPAAFGALQGSQIHSTSPNDLAAVKTYAASELLKIPGLVTPENKPENKKVLEAFEKYVTSKNATDPKKTVAEFWKEFVGRKEKVPLAID